MTLEKKHVLILCADAGFGHRSASNAVAEAIRDKYDDQLEVVVINPLEEPTTPTFLCETQYDYDKWVRNVPELYALGFEASDRPIPTAILERSISVLLVDTMRELFKRYQPDVVLSAYPWYQAAMSLLFTSKKYRVPQFTVVTDLATVHRMWFHKKVDACLVPNRLVADLGMGLGMPSDKLIVTGIPVSPAIDKEARDKNAIRAELGWQPDLTTILAVGSKRVERLVDSLNVINHYGGNIQVAVVCGKDENLYNELNRFEWHIPAKVYEYSDQMPTLMKASDLMLCKAGGLIVTESLAAGLPMLLTEIIAGQETGNADYVVDYGAGDIADSPILILERLSHLLMDNGSLLKKLAQNARALGLPQAAYSVADLLHKAAFEPDRVIKHTRKANKFI